MLHLPLGDQLLDRTGHILDRHVGVYAVLVKEVYRVDSQPLQRGVGDAADLFRSTIEPVGGGGTGIAVTESKLRRDHHLTFERLERLAHELLVGERSVHLGGVEEGDAALHRGADDADHVIARPHRFIAETHLHAPEAERRDARSAFTDLSIRHLSLRLCRQRATTAELGTYTLSPPREGRTR